MGQQGTRAALSVVPKFWFQSYTQRCSWLACSMACILLSQQNLAVVRRGWLWWGVGDSNASKYPVPIHVMKSALLMQMVIMIMLAQERSLDLPELHV